MGVLPKQPFAPRVARLLCLGSGKAASRRCCVSRIATAAEVSDSRSLLVAAGVLPGGPKTSPAVRQTAGSQTTACELPRPERGKRRDRLVAALLPASSRRRFRSRARETLRECSRWSRWAVVHAQLAVPGSRSPGRSRSSPQQAWSPAPRSPEPVRIDLSAARGTWTLGAAGTTKDSRSDPTNLRPLATLGTCTFPSGERPFLSILNGTFLNGGSLASTNSSLRPNGGRSRLPRVYR